MSLPVPQVQQTGAASWPWAPDDHRVTGPEGTVTVVSALALPDLPHSRAVVGQQMPVMAAAVHAEVGLMHPQLQPALLPLSFVRRPQAIAELVRLRDAMRDPQQRVVEVRGFGCLAAQEALLEWDDGPHAGAVFVTATVPALFRTAGLS